MVKTSVNFGDDSARLRDLKVRLTEVCRDEDILAAARMHLSRGWQPIPIPGGEKAPRFKNWPDLRVTESNVRQHFPGRCNIGLLTGEPSGGLVDVDLDCAEAIA